MQKLKLTKKYQKYPEYKDSGVEWLGEIPEDWVTLKAKSFISEKESGIWGNDPENDVNDIKCLRVADFDFEKISFSNVETVRNNPNLKHKKILRNGDILLEKSGGGEKTPVGRAIFFESKEKMVCANFIDIIRVKKEIDPKFFTYQLFASYSSKLNLRSIKQNTGIQNLDISSYFTEQFPVPNKTDQIKLSQYLGLKTALIDQIIEKKQKMIELLEEKRITYINNKVNNIDGYSEKLKYIASERNTKIQNFDTDSIYIAMENIEAGTGVYLPSKEIILPESIVNLFKTGDVLFGKLRPYLAKVYSPHFEGICSGEFLVLKSKHQKILSQFLFYKLISKDFIQKVNDSTYGTRMPRASWQFIGNQFLTYPTLLEQERLVGDLNNKNKIYKELTVKVVKSIELLQEFKSSLISHIVTGKIKV